MNRRTALISLGVAAMAGLAWANAARADKPAVYTGLVPGVGAGGHDVVAYFAEGRPREGFADITASHGGVTYRFSSAANRDAFTASPARYLPVFGGYCAWAVANGYTAKGDPEAWSVEGGKLYLNYSKSVRANWLRDVPGNIAKGQTNWPKVLE